MIRFRKLCTASRDAHNVKRIVIIMMEHFNKMFFLERFASIVTSILQHYGSYISFIKNKIAGQNKKQVTYKQKLFIEHNRSNSRIRLCEKKTVMMLFDALPQISIEEANKNVQ